MRLLFQNFLVLALMFLGAAPALADSVDLKGIGRFEGWRDNSVVGYGVVVGLSGSGDSRRNRVTQQTMQNVLTRMGLTVQQEDINGRNVAVVMVTATLPPSANMGERINVTVSSAGDARSLAGGVLLMTHLNGPDGKVYAVAQGPLITGGYNFESEGSFQQRNFPTSGKIERGATVERPVRANILKGGELSFLLYDPDFATSEQIAVAINQKFGTNTAWAVSADEVRIRYKGATDRLTRFVSEIQALKVDPQIDPRIVINERTGTVVAGGNVQISPVVVSQGEVRVTVQAHNQASQPGGYVGGYNPNIGSLLIRNTELDVEDFESVVASFDKTSIGDLIQGLKEAGVDTREMIGILQAMKDAGALHARLIVQ